MQSVYRVLIIGFGLFIATADANAAKDGPGPTYRRNRGRIVFQEAAFTAFGTEKELTKLVNKARLNKTLRKAKSGNWELHFLAFMRKAPGAAKVNLVWYKLGKKREQVDFTEFTMPPTSVTLRAKARLMPAQGFKAGDRLEGRITRLVGGKEKVFAKCRLTLK